MSDFNDLSALVKTNLKLIHKCLFFSVIYLEYRYGMNVNVGIF